MRRLPHNGSLKIHVTVNLTKRYNNVTCTYCILLLVVTINQHRGGYHDEPERLAVHIVKHGVLNVSATVEILFSI